MAIKEEMIEKLFKQKYEDSENLLNNKKKMVSKWFKELRNQICESFENIENNFRDSDRKINFEKKIWNRDGGGGGTISTMRGNVFEKVGVNISTVYGKLSRH